jgi:tetratricopeptide (TPR) repeat protein
MSWNSAKEALTPRAVGGPLAARLRWYRLRAHRLVGLLQKTRLYRCFPLAGWLAAVAFGLGATQVLVNKVLGNFATWGDWYPAEEPHLGWFTLTNVLLAFAILIPTRWIIRARERVVVDDFVDFTTDDAQAVSGLATLLATELSRLRDLYTSINHTLAVPVAVGVHSQEAAGRAAEPGAFQTVRADDLSDMLSATVASEAKISVGPLLVPIGTFVALFGRLVRGPRVLGSVHRTDSGGGPILTAQIVGGRDRRTWRVDRSHLAPPTTPEGEKAYLDDMVRELAIEMFTDMTMRGAVRWRAIRTFTQYLRDYRRSMRTPKTRTRFLKDAEEKLLEAIAEDEQFDFAYYNLGVIYSQLAATELSTARRWDVTPDQKVNPEKVHDSRMEAAEIAFKRAIERNRNRWEAYYALAVHHMARTNRHYEEGGPGLSDDDLDTLREVIRLCDRVIDMKPRFAEAHDLKGMAIFRLVLGGATPEKIDEAIASHRTAVRLSWRNLCREERRAKAEPPTTESPLTKRQDNATAALHNLARAYGRKASQQQKESQRRGPAAAVNYRRANATFKQAIKLAPRSSAAGSHFERGRLLHDQRKFRQAQRSFEKAAIREPENPLYFARVARAHAECAKKYAVRAKKQPEAYARAEPHVEQACKLALEALAPVWRRALSDMPNHPDRRKVQLTFRALLVANDTLASVAGENKEAVECRAERIVALNELGTRYLKDKLNTAEGRAVAEDRFRLATCSQTATAESEPERSTWEAEQIGVALARAYVTKTDGSEGDLKGALDVLNTLIEFVGGTLDDSGGRSGGARPAAIQAHELEIRRANVLRRQESDEEALKCVSAGLVRDPLSENGRCELAETHMRLWQYDEALTAWEHTLWLKPNDPFVHFKLALCHWWRARGSRDRVAARRSLANAATLMEEAYQLFSREDVLGRSWVRLWRGRLALERERLDDAIMHLRSASCYEDCRALARALLAEAYFASQEYELASGEFEAAIEAVDADPQKEHDHVDARWGDSMTTVQLLARCHRGAAGALVEQGDPAGARERIEEEALEAAGRIRAGEDRAQTMALCYLTDALAILSPMESMAEADMIAQAQTQLAKAIALHPTPLAYLHMAQVHELAWERKSDLIERRRLHTEVMACKSEIDRVDGEGEIGVQAAAIAKRIDDAYFAGIASTNGSP